jgi:hypothetical protein
MNTFYISKNQDNPQIDDFEDFEYTSHNLKLVSNRFDKHKESIQDKHFYQIKLVKRLSRTTYHNFSFDKLQMIIRKLTNGMMTYGSPVSNRTLWNKYFLGGFRMLGIKMLIVDEYPTFTYNNIVFSDYDNLDVRLKSHLNTRVKIIDNDSSIEIFYLGKYSDVDFSKVIENEYYVDFSSPHLNKFGDKMIYSLKNNQFQRPKWFGKLFKTN